MESSISDDVTLSAADSELPDMVPVSIRTALPEFQHCSLERVLAGLLLTWQEFLQLFDICVEAKDFYIMGSNGVKSDLSQRIGDYVNTFRRKLKVYPVTLERVEDPNKTEKGQRLSIDSTPTRNDNQSTTMMDNKLASGSASKKLKLMDQDKSKRNHRKSTKESLEKIAQSVIHEQTTPVSASKRPSNTNVKKEAKRGVVKSRSPTPQSTDQSVNVNVVASTSTESHSAKATTASGVPVKLKRLSTSTNHSQVKGVTPSTSSGVVKKGRKPRKSLSRRSTKESMNTVATLDSRDEDSSDSDVDEEEDPTKEKKMRLKQSIIKFLKLKVSPRSFLRLRNELMDLREQEKYFKVTTVVPMTAGMMEQTFCRKLTE